MTVQIVAALTALALYAPGSSLGVIHAVSRQSELCAEAVSRPVNAKSATGSLFDVLHELMVSEALAARDLPGSTFGIQTPGTRAAATSVTGVDIPAGISMLEALNQIVVRSPTPVGWAVIEGGSGKPERCQLALMFDDAVAWTAYDIARLGRL